MPKILVINGPNMSLLGIREPEIYGKQTIEDINGPLKKLAGQNNCDIDFFQSNHEGEIVDKIGNALNEKVNAIIINPAAYTHTSLAIRDAINAVNIPSIEVHLSNIYSREEIRQNSIIAPACRGQIAGFGANSYYLALNAAIAILKSGE